MNSLAKAIKQQVFQSSPDKLVLDECNTISGCPFADSFLVWQRFEFEELDRDRVRLSLTVNVEFKKRLVVAGLIRRNTEKECKMLFVAFYSFLDAIQEREQRRTGGVPDAAARLWTMDLEQNKRCSPPLSLGALSDFPFAIGLSALWLALKIAGV